MPSSPASGPLDRFFESYFRLRPVNATFTGMHDHDHALPDWSPDGLEDAVSEMEGLRATLRGVAATHPGVVDDIERADLELAERFLTIQLEEHHSSHFQRGNPALYSGEAIFGVLAVMIAAKLPAFRRAGLMEQRLRAIPDLFAQGRRSLDRPRIPVLWIERALVECGAAQELFRHGLGSWCAALDLPGDAADRLGDAATPALSAFHDWAVWLRTLEPDDPYRSGCGADLFDLLLERGHWCSRPRTELLAQARTELVEADERLDRMARSIAHGGWPDIAQRLAVHHPSPDGYFQAFSDTWNACRDRATERDLVTWPDCPLRFLPLPTWARRAAPRLYFLNYRSPPPIGPPVVVDYFVPPVDGDVPPPDVERSLRAANYAVIKLNHVVHHGAIGHHLQNAHASRAASRIGRIAAVDCASRIGMFSGGTLAEGWACYAVDLMEQVGFLTDLEAVAQQHGRVRQLARAIVDIELHQATMSDADARRFYRDRAGMSAEAAAKEVTRNTMFPGSAVMYWLGTQAVHRLRGEREAAEGRAFSLRVFHDRFLGYGALPVFLIAQLMSRDRTTPASQMGRPAPATHDR